DRAACRACPVAVALVRRADVVIGVARRPGRREAVGWTRCFRQARAALHDVAYPGRGPAHRPGGRHGVRGARPARDAGAVLGRTADHPRVCGRVVRWTGGAGNPRAALVLVAGVTGSHAADDAGVDRRIVGRTARARDARAPFVLIAAVARAGAADRGGAVDDVR